MGCMRAEQMNISALLVAAREHEHLPPRPVPALIHDRHLLTQPSLRQGWLVTIAFAAGSRAFSTRRLFFVTSNVAGSE